MQIYLKVHQSEAFETADRREKLARMVALLINGGERGQLPAKVTQSNSYHYVVDSGNDWWVDIEQDDPTLIRLTHRYYDHSSIMAYTYLLAKRLYAKIVIKNKDTTETIVINGRVGFEAMKEILRKAETLSLPATETENKETP